MQCIFLFGIFEIDFIAKDLQCSDWFYTTALPAHSAHFVIVWKHCHPLIIASLLVCAEFEFFMQCLILFGSLEIYYLFFWCVLPFRSSCFGRRHHGFIATFICVAFLRWIWHTMIIEVCCYFLNWCCFLDWFGGSSSILLPLGLLFNPLL
jgi:hypothetical protein